MAIWGLHPAKGDPTLIYVRTIKQVLTSGGSRGWSVESHLTIRVRGKVASGGCRKPLVVSIESIVFCKKNKYLKLETRVRLESSPRHRRRRPCGGLTDLPVTQ